MLVPAARCAAANCRAQGPAAPPREGLEEAALIAAGAVRLVAFISAILLKMGRGRSNSFVTSRYR